MIPTSTDFDTEVTLETGSRPLPEEPPFRMLLLGDWSGRESSALSELFQSRPISIDRDNFDEVFAKMNVRLGLDFSDDGSESLLLKFDDLDGFHPDQIFEQVPMFSELRGLRRRLMNESSFNEAAAEVRNWFENDKHKSETEAPEANVEGVEDSVEPGGLLDSILDNSGGGEQKKYAETVQSKELSRFLGNIVRSHIVQTDESEQSRLVNIVDEASGELMRSILHHPKFQELEASWRGVYLLIRKIETDVDLKIYLLDLSKTELLGNLKFNGSLADCDLYQWLVRDAIETPGAEPWATVCGNYTFEANVEDTAALMRIAKISEMANAAFISHFSPILFGVSSLANAPGFSEWRIDADSESGRLWTMLRSIPEAGFLGLATPRFLSRLPYGNKTDPTERFSFEEFSEGSAHDGYLWTNPTFLCAILLAQTYRKYGWEMIQGFQYSISGLPTHVYEEDGETKTKPCAEMLMTEPICQLLLDEGLMPMISFKNTDRIQLGRFQSIALPAKGLGGKWS